MPTETLTLGPVSAARLIIRNKGKLRAFVLNGEILAALNKQHFVSRLVFRVHTYRVKLKILENGDMQLLGKGER